MTSTVVVLYILLNGCTCDTPKPFAEFGRSDVCARVAVVVQAEVRRRFRYPDAITYCQTTAAPLVSFAPPARPIEEAAN